jgi:hypothetical protein
MQPSVAAVGAPDAPANESRDNAEALLLEVLDVTR